MIKEILQAGGKSIPAENWDVHEGMKEDRNE